jgi:UPF0755 protein
MKQLRTLLILLFIFVMVNTGLLVWYVWGVTQYRNPAATTVLIEPGTSVKGIASLLSEEGIITDARVLEYGLRLTGRAQNIQAGEYEFKKGADFFETMEILATARMKHRSFTIPEGHNLRQIGHVLVKEQQIMTQAEFDALLQGPELVALLGADGLGITGITTPEGFLFPDTYDYTRGTPGKTILKRMIENFITRYHGEFKDLSLPALAGRPMTALEIVTLASLVEKETGLASERPRIAGVFYNRLTQGMLLQTDPAVIYGVKDFDGNLTRAHLAADTPYNTYTRPGLPPGPICSVGLEALRAALSPAATTDLYFVAKGDGSHYFSTTLEQHNAAVRHYQLKQGDPPPE